MFQEGFNSVATGPSAVQPTAQRPPVQRGVARLVERLRIAAGARIARRPRRQDRHMLLAHAERAQVVERQLLMADLGFLPAQLEKLRYCYTQPYGCLLVTGPTGSGKSTTLAAMLDYLNGTKYQHILTIEDPIEFVHESKKCLINQREVHRDTLGFSEALRSALREDPDIILVGEMRDLETIRLALTAAETGHLVFGTLHTTSAAKTIDRVVDVFPAEEKSMVRSMLSESLQAVISQTLLKKIGGGRVAAHEIMMGTPAIRNLIREDKVAQMYSAIQTGGNIGMQTLDMCLKSLVAKGLVTRDAAREKAKVADGI